MPRAKPNTTELLERHRWTIYGLAQDGLTAKQIAERLGCTDKLVTRAANRAGIDLPKPPPTYKRNDSHPSFKALEHRDWWPEAVKLREDGATYEAIGKAFGVTRERVRQILHHAGRSDLTGPGHANKARVRPVFTCEECGKEFRKRQWSLYSPFCSITCGNAFRAREFYKRDLPRAEKIVRHRENGKGWHLTAAYTGFTSGSICEMFLLTFCRKHNRMDLLERAQGMRHSNAAE